jgi:threonine dehydrogenase-like Zn-dependent dehydrogenase
VAPEVNPSAGNWEPGDGPGQVLEWATQAVAKAGTISVVGVYPPQMTSFPIGLAMNKNVTVKMGNCNHRRYLPELIDVVASGRMSLSANVTQQETFETIIDAYQAFDRRQPGWIKVVIAVSAGSGMQVSGRAAVDASSGKRSD